MGSVFTLSEDFAVGFRVTHALVSKPSPRSVSPTMSVVTQVNFDLSLGWVDGLVGSALCVCM